MDFIFAIYEGTYSIAPNKVLKGDKDLAHAAHSYYERYDKQDLVGRYKASPVEYDYADLGKLYRIVRYEVRDIEKLKAWWFGEN